MGNTAITYHGTPTAIWDMRTWPSGISIAQAASGVAHEMFHAYQQTSMKIQQANELLLPQYPHNRLSVALTIKENNFLAQLCQGHDTIQHCLGNIAALRRQRESEVGASFMEYDKSCESEEGTAAYVEVHMKARIQGKSPFECASYYGKLLQDNGGILANYRHRCYAAGLALCLACDSVWPGWQTQCQESGQTIFDWISDRVPASEAVMICADSLTEAGAILKQYRHKNEQKICEFMSTPYTTIGGDIQLLSFDPMNIVCSNNRCLHLHGSLRINGNERLLATPFVAEYGDTIMDIKRIFLPA